MHMAFAPATRTSTGSNTGSGDDDTTVGTKGASVNGRVGGGGGSGGRGSSIGKATPFSIIGEQSQSRRGLESVPSWMTETSASSHSSAGSAWDNPPHTSTVDLGRSIYQKRTLETASSNGSFFSCRSDDHHNDGASNVAVVLAAEEERLLHGGGGNRTGSNLDSLLKMIIDDSSGGGGGSDERPTSKKSFVVTNNNIGEGERAKIATPAQPEEDDPSFFRISLSPADASGTPTEAVATAGDGGVGSASGQSKNGKSAALAPTGAAASDATRRKYRRSKSPNGRGRRASREGSGNLVVFQRNRGVAGENGRGRKSTRGGDYGHPGACDDVPALLPCDPAPDDRGGKPKSSKRTGGGVHVWGRTKAPPPRQQPTRSSSLDSSFRVSGRRLRDMCGGGEPPSSLSSSLGPNVRGGGGRSASLERIWIRTTTTTKTEETTVFDDAGGRPHHRRQGSGRTFDSDKTVAAGGGGVGGGGGGARKFMKMKWLKSTLKGGGSGGKKKGGKDRPPVVAFRLPDSGGKTADHRGRGVPREDGDGDVRGDDSSDDDEGEDDDEVGSLNDANTVRSAKSCHTFHSVETAKHGNLTGGASRSTSNGMFYMTGCEDDELLRLFDDPVSFDDGDDVAVEQQGGGGGKASLPHKPKAGAPAPLQESTNHFGSNAASGRPKATTDRPHGGGAKSSVARLSLQSRNVSTATDAAIAPPPMPQRRDGETLVGAAAGSRPIIATTDTETEVVRTSITARSISSSSIRNPLSDHPCIKSAPIEPDAPATETTTNPPPQSAPSSLKLLPVNIMRTASCDDLCINRNDDGNTANNPIDSKGADDGPGRDRTDSNGTPSGEATQGSSAPSPAAASASKKSEKKSSSHGRGKGKGKTKGKRHHRRRRSACGPVDVDEARFVDVSSRNLRSVQTMAARHLANGEHDEALSAFEEILRVQRTKHGGGAGGGDDNNQGGNDDAEKDGVGVGDAAHPRIGTALHNVGIVLLRAKKFERAIVVCEEAVQIRKQCLDRDDPELAGSLSQLGVAHLECEQYSPALVAFREALRIRQQSLGREHPKVAKILNNIGCALFELREAGAAKLAFDEALGIQRSVLTKVREQQIGTTTEAQGLLSIAGTQCNLASIALMERQFNEATVLLEEAMMIQQTVLGNEDDTVSNTKASIEYVKRAREARVKIKASMKDPTPDAADSAHPTSPVVSTDKPGSFTNVVHPDENAKQPTTWYDSAKKKVKEAFIGPSYDPFSETASAAALSMSSPPRSSRATQGTGTASKSHAGDTNWV